jgi:hypothetical protein
VLNGNGTAENNTKRCLIRSMAEWKERGYVPDSDDEEDQWPEALNGVCTPDKQEDNGEESREVSGSENVDVDLCCGGGSRFVDFGSLAVKTADAKVQVSAREPDSPDPENGRFGSLLPATESAHDSHVSSGNDNKQEEQLGASDNVITELVEDEGNRSGVEEQLEATLQSGLQTVRRVLQGSLTTSRSPWMDPSGSSSPLSPVRSFSEGVVEVHSAKNWRGLLQADPVSQEQDIRIDTGHEITQQPNARSPQQAVRRNLRQRNAIQIHPYLLEDARYRKEMLARGERPVHLPNLSRQRSPTAFETQEKEVGVSDKGNIQDLSSSRPGSSNPLQPIENEARRRVLGASAKNTLHSDDELPDLDAILDGERSDLPSLTSRSKRAYSASKASHRRVDDNNFHVYDLPSDSAGCALEESPTNAVFHVPPSPPRSPSPTSNTEEIGKTAHTRSTTNTRYFLDYTAAA